jgi:hypothetical protein
MDFIVKDDIDEGKKSNAYLPSDSSSLSKYMSESVRSEINDFQNQLLNEREVQ